MIYNKYWPLNTHSPNEIILKEDYAEIILRNRKCEEVGRTLIDLEDVERCKKYKWHIRDGYAYNNKIGKLSRFLLNVTAPKVLVDHKNHNKLDNRKENLRICSHAENSRNQKLQIGKTSKYKGVSWSKNAGKWQAQLIFKGKNYYIGYFINENEAALAYNEKAKELHGEFACLNKIS